MKYRLLLFDADDTLFDFRKSEKHAFELTLKDLGIHNAIPEFYERYREISLGLWAQLEKGEVTRDFVRVDRFRQLFSKFSIIADETKAARIFLEHLTQHPFLIDHAVEVCEQLKPLAKIGIVTNGFAPIQLARLNATPLAPLIDFTIASAACGYLKPDPRIFDVALEKAQFTNRQSVLMIGDRFEADIIGGHRSNLDTCWFNPLKHVYESAIKPTYEITCLRQLLPLVK